MFLKKQANRIQCGVSFVNINNTTTLKAAIVNVNKFIL